MVLKSHILPRNPGRPLWAIEGLRIPPPKEFDLLLTLIESNAALNVSLGRIAKEAID